MSTNIQSYHSNSPILRVRKLSTNRFLLSQREVPLYLSLVEKYQNTRKGDEIKSYCDEVGKCALCTQPHVLKPQKSHSPTQQSKLLSSCTLRVPRASCFLDISVSVEVLEGVEGAKRIKGAMQNQTVQLATVTAVACGLLSQGKSLNTVTAAFT